MEKRDSANKNNNKAKTGPSEDILQNLEWKWIRRDVELWLIEEIEKQKEAWEYYAQWFQGTIYKVSYDNKQYVAIKNRSNVNDLQKESLFQKKAHNLSQKVNNVGVPKMLGFIWGGSEYLVMEFIQWRTLFTIKVNETLRVLHKITWINKYTEVKTDKEALQEIKALILMIKKNQKYYSKVEKYIKHINLFKEWIPLEQWLAVIYDKLSKDFDMWIINKATAKKYESWLNQLTNLIHENWWHHNDLSHRNLIIWDDWILYVIDYWLSSAYSDGIIKDKFAINYFKYLIKSQK